jgi:hypothetical protein
MKEKKTYRYEKLIIEAVKDKKHKGCAICFFAIGRMQCDFDAVEKAKAPSCTGDVSVDNFGVYYRARLHK